MNNNTLDAGSICFFDPDLSLIKQTRDVRMQIARIAGNTGNVLFWDSLRQYFVYGMSIGDYEIPESARTLVLSMGNWISPHSDIGDLARAIEASRIEKIVVVGAGAQAQTSKETFSLRPGTRRFLDIAAERSMSIGVRGDFTAEILAKLGVHNVDVTGCPSVFMINGNFRSKPADQALRLAVHTTWHGHYRDCIRELLVFGRDHDAILVEQSDPHVMRLIQSGDLNANVNFMSRFYSKNHTEGWSLLDWIQKRGAFYMNLDSWKEGMLNVDFALGSRFHANIVAALSGARGLLLTLDTGTEELAQYYNFPHIRFQDFDASTSIEHYFDIADPSMFIATLPLRKARMEAFLMKNGLTLTDSFRSDPPPSMEVLGDPKPISGEMVAQARFLNDADKLQLSVGVRNAEAARRKAPLRDAEEGEEIDRAESILSYAERIGSLTQTRRRWRERQGVSNEYRHQPNPVAYDDREQKDNWQRQVYENAARIARAKKIRSVVDFGCGSGFKLLKYLSDFETVGVEIDPALSYLRSQYPDRMWRDGAFFTPDTFNADLVICSDVLEHLLEPDRLLSALASSKGGFFVFSTPALELLADRGASPRLGPPANPTHVYEWTTTEFRELIGEHLTILAHGIVNLKQATQMCVACRRGDDRRLTNVDLIFEGE